MSSKNRRRRRRRAGARKGMTGAQRAQIWRTLLQRVIGVDVLLKFRFSVVMVG